MSDGPYEVPVLRDRKTEAEGFLVQVAAALAGDGITATLSAEGGFPMLSVTDPHSAERDAATLVVDSDSWIECTWTPAAGTGAQSAARTIVAVLSAVNSGRQ